jgi:hypothetical protein
MRMTQILGAVALVIGLVLLGFAYHASNARSRFATRLPDAIPTRRCGT